MNSVCMDSKSKSQTKTAVTTQSSISPDDNIQSDSLTRCSDTYTSTRAGKRKGSEWEILGNLEKGVSYTIKPKKHDGFFLKRRKFPLKGWQKRFFVIEQGFLTYAKTETDLNRGRTLGRFNIGVAVISANYAGMRIDIDAEESVHHVKLDNPQMFGLFLEQLQQHRLYVQHQANCSITTTPAVAEDCVSPIQLTAGPPSLTFSSHRNSLLRGTRPARTNILSEMSQQDEILTNHIQHITGQLGALIDHLSKIEGGEHTGSAMKKLLKLKKKKSNGGTIGKSDRSSPVESESDMTSSTTLTAMSALSNSNPSLTSQSLGRTVTDLKSCAREEAVNMTIDIQADLASMQKEYLCKRDMIRQLLESDSKGSSLQPSMTVLASLRQALRTSQEQNQQLRTRLARIHAESDISEIPAMMNVPDTTSTLPRGMHNTLSFSSSCMSEFFDAREYVNSGEDTEEEEMDECESDASKSDTEDEQTFHEANATGEVSTFDKEGLQNGSSAPGHGSVDSFTGRRRELPVPLTEMEGVNLWNLLCKNIGKDLSKISMPVTLNEPLSTLQRLCEELEYSDLVDKAVSATSALDRMVWVAAFAISAYASTNARASHKPFNPLLGETYECVREDKGFRFIAEQVCHHPPVSCVHATGTDWVWSQALRIRSKFWGKSMEFQPEGKINLTLNTHNEDYVWNKVTSCIHNILGQERWVDLYGECVIQCSQSGLTARIQFVKASYWSNKRHEIFGTITDSDGNVKTNLFGKWSEALYIGKAPSARCIWR